MYGHKTRSDAFEVVTFGLMGFVSDKPTLKYLAGLREFLYEKIRVVEERMHSLELEENDNG